MAGGLISLLDDVATLARMAAASADDVAAAAGRASAKAVGVVVDDTAVTPQYLQGIKPERELPIIKRITWGSLRNKLLIILPVALLLSQFAPFLLPVILLVGGSYLCFEGMEKVWEKVSGHAHGEPALAGGAQAEDKVVKSAVTTDLILSAEIMIIALNEVAKEGLLARTIILVVVAFAITFLVYGIVALLVKMDDFGVHLQRRSGAGAQRAGHLIVAAMPKVLTAIGVIGTFAMVWVGGHILLASAADLGWHAPLDLVHRLEHLVDRLAVLGGFLGWLVNTLVSLAVGAVWGACLVGVYMLWHRLRPAPGTQLSA